MPSNLFDLTGKVAIVTGGAGLLGQRHIQAIAAAGGIPWSWDVETGIDICSLRSITKAAEQILRQHGRIDILINNAAINSETGGTRFEDYSLAQWDRELEVGLTGAFLCAQFIGGYMAHHGGGVILNIGSDFTNIAPDQRVYAPKVKPISYSVVKHGLLGLTRYLATYWAGQGVRVNMLSPGGVENGQGAEFVQKISSMIPLGRMAQPDEYVGAIQFLCSDASKYMNGANLIMDGGRSVW